MLLGGVPARTVIRTATTSRASTTATSSAST